MNKQQTLADPASCLNKADTLEPVFVLRAKDPLAPQTVRHWATMSRGRHEDAKLDEALKWADQAQNWRKKNIAEIAMPVAVAATASAQDGYAGSGLLHRG